MSYTLTNAESLNLAHPSTFLIPALEDRLSLRVGNKAQLLFDNKERMWVRVVRTDDGGYAGILVNHPISVDAKFGDRVEFQSHHVLNISRHSLRRST